MEKHSNGGDWAWVTHFLAVFFSVVCMGLIVYTVVWVSDLSVAKAAMGFSTSVLGVILGFYFNRERLTKESREKDYYSSQYTDLLGTNVELIAEQSTLLDTLTRTVEEAATEE